MANRNLREEALPTEAEKLCKSKVRRQILAKREQLEPEAKAWYDGKIREKILAHQAYQEAQIIMAYASYRSEVDTTGLIRQALLDGKCVFAPKVSGEEMEFWQIISLEDLRRGYKGIPEPAEDISFPEWIKRQDILPGTVPENSIGQKRDLRRGLYQAMMWMPGAAFDRSRHRIGYGKGFYDRYLERWHHREKQPGIRLTTAALAYSCQVVPQLPYEAHDVLPDLLVTEREIL